MLKKNIYLMYAISCLQGMVFYGPIVTLYRQVHGVTVFEITLIESISLILCLVLELPWGIVADRIGYKKTMVICCPLYFISKIIFWRADGFAAFLAERVILGIVIAGLLTAAFVYSTAIDGNYRLAGFMTVASYGAAAGIVILRAAFVLLTPLLTQMQNEQIVTANRAMALSINAVLTDSVGVGTNLVFGALGERSLTGALMFGAFLCACGLIFLELWKRRQDEVLQRR